MHCNSLGPIAGRHCFQFSLVSLVSSVFLAGGLSVQFSQSVSVSFLAGGGIPLPRACAHHPCAVLRSRGAKYSDFPVLVLLLVLALALRILAPALALGILAPALAGAEPTSEGVNDNQRQSETIRIN